MGGADEGRVGAQSGLGAPGFQRGDAIERAGEVLDRLTVSEGCGGSARALFGLAAAYCAGVSTQWTIHGEKLVDENRHIRLSTVDITLPDGVSFTQYVVAMPPAAMTLAVNDQREVLLMRRHRFIIDRWVWELPGGYVDGAEDIEAAAAREVEEETGWRPRAMEHMVTFQPAIGSVDQPQIIYLARGADLTDTPPDINEAQEIRWWPLEEAVNMIERGEIVGASTVVAVYRALTLV